MKEGDFIRIDYVGKISESNETFDSTREDVAKEGGIYNPKIKYGSIPVIIGANFVVKGLEEGLKEMEVGKKKKITVKPEDAFGERDAKLIKLLSMSEFKKQGITPHPGMPITINNVRGRILSISGGRVRVDFNHPLAGKTLEYEVEIEKEITDLKEKIAAILEYCLQVDEKDVDIKLGEELVEINIRIDTSKFVRKTIADMIKKWISEIKKVRFVDEY
ncbi:MAG: peptidylprolyl isomerase [Candidatus Aenigmarchaeota archaeon]|nr:peptidylprolyl isomerase [Candidatus Aenigmarchaeota archaeon]